MASQGIILRVNFTGLCLFVTEEAPSKLRVLLPDARGLRPLNMSKHVDDTRAVAHVGFVRFDRRYVAGTAPATGGEVVRRMVREAIHFEISDSSEGDISKLLVPNFSEFAPDLELNKSLLGSAPDAVLLARVELSGGTLSGEAAVDLKEVSRTIGSAGRISTHRYQHLVTWSRTVIGTSVSLCVTTFGGEEVERIPLQALREANGDFVVEVMIANLCADNPLEWDDYHEPDDEPVDDFDFKWFVRLFQQKAGTPPVVMSEASPVPFIKLSNPGGDLHGKLKNCNGARTS